jgi:SulP family sulfate permease
MNAGLIVFVLLIPQGMAYALLAGLPPVYGLYSSTVGLFVYALMGSCRQISMGPMAIMSLLTGQAIAKLGYEVGSQEWIDTAGAMAAIVGIMLLLMGMLNLGVLVNFLSHAVMSSFTTASACIIAVNQLKYILGLQPPRFEYTHELIGYLFSHLNEAKWYALLLGVSSFVGLYLARDWKRANKPNPNKPEQQALWYKVAYTAANSSGLICIFTMGFFAYLLCDDYDVSVVGAVPKGLKAPIFPIQDMQQIQDLLPQCLVIAVISFMGNWAIAKKFAIQFGYEVHASQELVAAGSANFVGAMFNGYVMSAGLARSAVNAEAGAKTPVSGAISASLIILALLFMTEAFFYIPMASLGAIILVSVTSMINYSDFVYAYKVDRNDFYVMVSTFLFTFFLGIMEGIFVGVILSIIFVVNSTAFPHVAHLGQIRGGETWGVKTSMPEKGSADTTYWRNIERFAEAKASQVPGVAVLRMDANLYFANTTFIKQEVFAAADGKYHECTDHITKVVLDMSSCIDIDMSGLMALENIHEELLRRKTSLAFAHVRGPVRDRLFKSTFMEKIGPEGFVHMNINDAVAYQRMDGGSPEDDLAALGNLEPLETEETFGGLTTSGLSGNLNSLYGEPSPGHSDLGSPIMTPRQMSGGTASIDVGDFGVQLELTAMGDNSESALDTV